VIVASAIADGAAQIQRGHVGEGFVDNENVVVGESRELEALRAGACVRDDVTALLEDALQSPTHPIVAAGDERERRPFNGQLH
jgi:hypothetical protein